MSTLYYFISFCIICKDYNFTNPQLLKLLNYSTFKFSTTINFKFSKQIILINYISLNKLSNLLASGVLYKFSLQPFKEVIFSYYQIVIAFTFKQLYNIYTNAIKERGSLYRKQSFFLLLLVLILAYFTRVIILANVIIRTLLVIFARYFYKSGFSAKITSFIMQLLYNFCSLS